MRADCESVMRANAEDLKGIDLGQAGHDFWLTRNGHGSGLWDRNRGEVGQGLAEAAETYGAIDLCVGMMDECTT